MRAEARCIGKVCSLKIGFNERGPEEVRSTEVCSGEVRLAQVGVTKYRVSEVRSCELCSRATISVGGKPRLMIRQEFLQFM